MPSLDGRIVAITGQRRAEEMAEMIRRLGGVPYVATTVNLRFRESREEAERLAKAILEGVDWAVFYTGVGVRAIFEAAERLGEPALFLKRLESVRVLSRGEKARRALRENGRPPDLRAAPATTEGVIDALLKGGITESTIFVQTPGPMPEALPVALNASRARLIYGSPYRFLPPGDPNAVRRLIRALIEREIDVITFTSPPAVNNLFLAADDLGQADDLTRALNERVFTASVGPVTSGAIRDHGVGPALEADSQRMGGLLQDLAQALSPEKEGAGSDASSKTESPRALP